MVVEVLQPGLLTTVQDRGRRGYQKYGVPPAGAVDEYALRVANCLLGNPDHEAALEATLLGPTLRFEQAGWIAITGADLGARLNDAEVPLWETIPVAEGDILSFDRARWGMRAYVAFAGGIDLPVVLGSRATYARARLGGLDGRPLQKGDRLPVRGGACSRRRLPQEWVPRYGLEPIRVVLGPHQDRFTEEGLRAFLSGEYRVLPDSDRMGLRLEGPRVEHVRGADIISGPVCTGAVQVPGNGQPIVLLADRQTTGGYTQIATVITADLYRLGQARPGDAIRFEACSLQQAQRALREPEEHLARIKQLVDRGELDVVERLRLRTHRAAYDVQVRLASARELTVGISGTQFRVQLVGTPGQAAEGQGEGRLHALRAPMPGQVVNVLVGAGDRVERGDRLAVLETLKMEIELASPASGVVSEVRVAKGAQVQDGQVMILITEGG
ncbi:MAG: 5-oxoprolinase/urea amidolyase family protein [Bacillota bacterium]